MAKFQSPLLGYNNNVRHKNRVFHIQTEDSGVQHPHVITHLFMDGGRILKSIKKSYAEHVGNDDLSNIVRQLMKEQHKAMFIALRDGQFDHLVDPGAASTRDPAPKSVAKEAKPAAAGEPATAAEAKPAETTVAETKAAASERNVKAAEAKPAEAKPVEGKSAETKPAETKPAETKTAASERNVKAAEAKPVEGKSAETKPAETKTAASERNVKAAEPVPTPGGTSAEDRPAREMPRAPAIRPKTVPSMPAMIRAKSVDDVAAVGKKPEPLSPIRPAAKHPPTSSSLRAAAPPRLMLDLEHPESTTDVGAAARGNELPPPLNTFAKQPAVGTYRTSDTSAKHQIDHVPMPPLKSTGTKHPSSKPPPEGRYAPARPASIFESSATAKPSSSIFSDDLINDKSLDEVILSYLAEDLDPPRRK